MCVTCANHLVLLLYKFCTYVHIYLRWQQVSVEVADDILCFVVLLQVINAPAAQPAEQHPTMTDIAAAITQEPAAAANEVVLGEDEEADEALTALDHIDFAAPDAAVTDEAASTTVAVPVTAVSSSFVGGNSSSSDADGFAGLFKGWVAAVMKMFEDWQKSLAPK